MRAVSLSSARISVHTGTWSHDVNQAKLLPLDKVINTAPFFADIILFTTLLVVSQFSDLKEKFDAP